MRANPPSNPAPEPGSNTGGHSEHLQHIPVLIDARHAAAILEIGQRTLAKYTATGAVPSVKIGTLRRYVLAELHAWIEAGCPIEAGAGDSIRAELRGGAR